MTRPTQTSLRMRLLFAGIAGALAIGAIATLPAPAQARVWVSFGAPCCGYYGPGPYYGSPFSPTAITRRRITLATRRHRPITIRRHRPPTRRRAHIHRRPRTASSKPAPSAYAPPAAAPANPSPASSITYTSKPAFTNASGQTCRQYMTNNGSGQPVYGTACQQADGVWRVVN